MSVYLGPKPARMLYLDPLGIVYSGVRQSGL